MRNTNTIDTIMIHCSATQPQWYMNMGIFAQKQEIERWHVDGNGWNGIAYAWLISRLGDEIIGRDLDGDGDPWEEIGAGAKGHNSRTIHICLIGGHAAKATDKFADHFTPEQNMVLRRKIRELREQFPSIKRVIGHNEVANKGCPGFNVGDWLAEPTKPAKASPRPEKPGLAAFFAAIMKAIFGRKPNDPQR